MLLIYETPMITHGWPNFVVDYWANPYCLCSEKNANQVLFGKL